ncbi:unnamed protein product [Orchesella dallaii]|uniref:CCHC-type domain-containing protein n=1 Tax=Orchesella dallaii TaxID=48710 RepID=A0ABP1SA93_9HEXA
MSATTKPVVKDESSSSSSSTAPSPTPAAMSTIGILHPFDSTTDDFEVWVETFAAYLAANGLLDPQEDMAKAKNERAQKSLFTKDDSINLKDVLASALAHELAETSTALIRGQQQNTEATNVHQSSSSRSHKKKGKSQNGQPQQQGEGSSTQQSGKNRNSNKKSCPNCGSSKHVTARECPHKDVICHNCEKPGHFARFCRSKSKNANLVNLDHVSDNRIVRAQVNNTKQIIN